MQQDPNPNDDRPAGLIPLDRFDLYQVQKNQAKARQCAFRDKLRSLPISMISCLEAKLRDYRQRWHDERDLQQEDAPSFFLYEKFVVVLAYLHSKDRQAELSISAYAEHFAKFLKRKAKNIKGLLHSVKQWFNENELIDDVPPPIHVEPPRQLNIYRQQELAFTWNPQPPIREEEPQNKQDSQENKDEKKDDDEDRHEDVELNIQDKNLEAKKQRREQNKMTEEESIGAMRLLNKIHETILRKVQTSFNSQVTKDAGIFCPLAGIKRRTKDIQQEAIRLQKEKKKIQELTRKTQEKKSQLNLLSLMKSKKR